MTRNWLLGLLALILVTPALAQVINVPRMPRPVVVQPIQVQPVSPTDAPAFDPALTPETARAAIDKLKARNRELRQQMTVTLGDLQTVRTQLDEITRAGGSLVRAQCVSDALSRRTDGGGEENCHASGYVCGGVEGTCMRQCSTSNQCAPGFVCDTGAARCVVPPTGD